MDVERLLADIVGSGHVLTGDAISEDDTHDEALTGAPGTPAYIVRPASAEEVCGVLRVAAERGVPVTARGSGTGLSGAAVPRPDGILVSFQRMAAILEIDEDNHVAVVQPGVTLSELGERTQAAGLAYPVHPGELSASLGGNIGTNAGGMRAVKYGVTRQHVLGVQAALPTGELIRTGGRFVKASSGYDLTQLIVGSEGTLALVTEAILRLQPRLVHHTTVLAPFTGLEQLTRGIPRIIASGLEPHILEYVDAFTMDVITQGPGTALGIPDEVRASAAAYLLVALEDRDPGRLEEDVALLGGLLTDLGANEVFVLSGPSARRLVEAREKAFWAAKAAGADDVVDVVVPRSAIPEFLTRAQGIADTTGSVVIGCGHAGDGNVHLAVFQKDPGVRHRLLREMFAAGMASGGAISGEHGIGTAKKPYFLELEDPAKIDLMRRIKQAFDPAGILNPDVLFDSPREKEA